MKSVRFHPQAEAELSSSVAFYDQEREGLGTEFGEEVARAVAFVTVHPDAGTPIRKKLRRWRIRRFPFVIIHRVEDGHLYILALAHQRRKPGYWHYRI